MLLSIWPSVHSVLRFGPSPWEQTLTETWFLQEVQSVINDMMYLLKEVRLDSEDSYHQICSPTSPGKTCLRGVFRA